jgi:hypothetical protein
MYFVKILNPCKFTPCKISRAISVCGLCVRAGQRALNRALAGGFQRAARIAIFRIAFLS